MKEYNMPVSGRSYRQGTSKTFFNYLLIDPRVADVSLGKSFTVRHTHFYLGAIKGLKIIWALFQFRLVVSY